MILNGSFGDRIEIWVMDDYGVGESWKHTFTANKQHLGRKIWNVKIVCFLEYGDVLMVYDHRALLHYNLQTTLLSELINIDHLLERFHAIAREGTLVSPQLRNIAEEMELD